MKKFWMIFTVMGVLALATPKAEALNISNFVEGIGKFSHNSAKFIGKVNKGIIDTSKKIAKVENQVITPLIGPTASVIASPEGQQTLGSAIKVGALLL